METMTSKLLVLIVLCAATSLPFGTALAQEAPPPERQSDPAAQTALRACAAALREAGQYTEAENRLAPPDNRTWAQAAEGCLGFLASMALAATQTALEQSPSVGNAAARLRSSEALQPAITESAGTQGSLAQSEAVPSVMPVARQGGTVALSTTPAGPRLITALAINPWGLSSSSATAFRLFDLSVQLPINVLNPNTPMSTTFDYVGIRLRFNIGAFFASDNTRRIQNDVAGRLRVRAEQVRVLSHTVHQSIQNASDRVGCAHAIWRAARNRFVNSDVPQGCDITSFERLGNDLRAAEAAADSAIDQMRLNSDPWYAGLDARIDLGDPTLQATPGTRDNVHILVAAAAGWRAYRTERFFMDLRGRIGFAYASTPSAMQQTNSTDWGAAIGLHWLRGARALSVSVGFEGRHASGDTNPLAMTNFTNLRIGLMLPAAESTGLSVGFLVPIEPRSPALVTLGGDWSLLAGGRASGGS